VNRKKNYLTLDNDKGYRYRNRNNSINYKSWRISLQRRLNKL